MIDDDIYGEEIFDEDDLDKSIPSLFELLKKHNKKFFRFNLMNGWVEFDRPCRN